MRTEAKVLFAAFAEIVAGYDQLGDDSALEVYGSSIAPKNPQHIISQLYRRSSADDSFDRMRENFYKLAEKERAKTQSGANAVMSAIAKTAQRIVSSKRFEFRASADTPGGGAPTPISSIATAAAKADEGEENSTAFSLVPFDAMSIALADAAALSSATPPARIPVLTSAMADINCLLTAGIAPEASSSDMEFGKNAKDALSALIGAAYFSALAYKVAIGDDSGIAEAERLKCEVIEYLIHAASDVANAADPLASGVDWISGMDDDDPAYELIGAAADLEEAASCLAWDIMDYPFRIDHTGKLATDPVTGETPLWLLNEGRAIIPFRIEELQKPRFKLDSTSRSDTLREAAAQLSAALDDFDTDLATTAYAEDPPVAAAARLAAALAIIATAATRLAATLIDKDAASIRHG